MLICSKCGAQFWEETSNSAMPVCQMCRYNDRLYKTIPYNYKCPCGGEFTYPQVKAEGYVCPFCNKRMEGM